VLDESPVKIHGTDILPKSRVDFGGDTGTETVVHFYLTKDAGKRFEAFTGTHMNQFLAIVMDNEIISCPSIDGRIGAEGIITGFKDDKGMERANDLSILLNAGALPVPVEVVENRTISATLGADSIRSSLWAGLIGVSAVLLFMAFYYRLPGLLADVALMIYCLMLLAAMWVFHATLTLPGIAGIILSIGMAVDANVLIFERIKEELQAQKTLKSAVDAGFHRAWTAIVDSNLCSIITGIILYAYGTGPIKGFAITLIIGVSLSFFTAVTVTRHLMDFAANSRWARNPRLFGA
jgi:protein-export membrane protein SecD